MGRQLISKSPDDLTHIAGQMLETHSRKKIFAFYGAMGAGKTTFIKAVCRVLGVPDTVTSPSFALVNQYDTGRGEPVYHFDFYRIKRWEEVLDIGYEDYFFSGNYCLIEWPEKIEHLLPGDTVKVFIREDIVTGNRIFEF